ncbi:MAG: hypothetical protein QXO16_01380 [Archaeoglobaceae archaeon]
MRKYLIALTTLSAFALVAVGLGFSEDQGKNVPLNQKPSFGFRLREYPKRRFRKKSSRI